MPTTNIQENQNSWLPARVAFMMLLFVGVAGYSVSLSLDHGWAAGVLVGLCMIPSVIMLQPMVTRRNMDFFQPTAFVLLNLILGVSLRSILIISNTTDPDIQRLFLLDEELSFFIPAAFWIILSMCLFLVGYNINTGTLRSRIGFLNRGIESWKPDRVLFLSVILLSISAYSIYDFITQLSITDITGGSFSKKRILRVDGEKVALGYQRWGASLGELCFYMLLIFKLLRRKSFFSAHGVLLVISGSIAILFPVFTSSKISVVFVGFNVLMLYSYIRDIPSKRFLPYGLVLMVLIVVMSRSRTARDASVTDLVSGISVTETFGALIQNRNQLGITKTAHIMDAVPNRMEFAYGSTMIGWIWAPIPKTWWKEKPVVLTGPTVTEKVYGLNWKYNGGVPPGLVADLYWNFGYAGILIGYFVVGFLTRRMYDFFSILRRKPNALLLYIGLLYSLVFVLHSNGVVYAITTFLQSIVPALLVIIFLTLPRIQFAWPKELR